MRLASISLACVLSSPLVAAQALPPELAKLVPEEAVLFVAARSPDALAAELESLRMQVEPEGATLTGRALLAKLALELDVPGDVTELDGARPAGLALRVGRGDAYPTFLLPTRDADKWIASTAGSPEKLSFTKANGWVACTVGDAPPSSGKPSRLVENWPNTVIAARLDAARLVASFKLEIDAVLGQFEQMIDAGVFEQAAGPADMTEMFELYLQFAKDLVASADVIELVADTARGEHALRGELRNKPGSPLAKFGSTERVDWLELARRVEPSAALQLIGCYSQADLAELTVDMYSGMFESLADTGAVPRELVDAFEAVFEHSAKLQSVGGRELACSVDLGADGVRGAFSLCPPDLAAYEQAWRAFLGDAAFAPLGLVVEPAQPLELAGVTATSWKLAYDFEKLAKLVVALQPDQVGAADEVRNTVGPFFSRMFGASSLRVVFASAGPRIGAVTCSDANGAWREQALKRVLHGGEPSKELARIASELEGANPGYGMFVDVSRIVIAVAHALEGTPLAEQDSDDTLGALQSLGAAPMPVAMQWWVRGGNMGFVVRVGSAGLGGFLSRIRAIETSNDRRALARSDLAALQWGLVRWAAHHDGAYPAKLDELGALDPTGEAFADVPGEDPWGRPYVYERSPDGAQFVVRTLGSDGALGGRGEAGDLSTDELPVPEYVPSEEPYTPVDDEADEGESGDDE